MDPKLAMLVDGDTPKLNKDLAEGIATKHLDPARAEAYLDAIWRTVARGFPPDLVYVGGERCGPQEELNEFTRKKNNRRTYDLAVSNTYMMQYTFRYQGQEIRRNICLPFVKRGGVIQLSGSKYCISPVLADRVISIPGSNIFVKLNRAKVTFERSPHHYLAYTQQPDGTNRERRETAQVAWSMLYHKAEKVGAGAVKPMIRANTCLVHYLLCKYGFTEMFRQFAGCNVVVGGPRQITEQHYPLDQWVICSTTGTKPKTYGWKHYTPSQIVVAIRREEYTPTVRNYLAGLYYVLDHFPGRLDVEHPQFLEHLESRRHWMILLGEILFSSNVNHGKLADDIAIHMESLDEYVDEVMKVNFRKIQQPVEDLYQLLGIVIERFDEWVLSAQDNINSMYNKELSVRYYVLNDIVQAINKFYFRLKAASRKGLTFKEVENLFNMIVKPRLIFSISRSHGEISTIMIPGDNMCFKMTSILVPQAASNKMAGRKDMAIGDPANFLHVSVAEVGSYANLPKAEPSGRSRLNLHCRVDSEGLILRNPERAELLDRVQEMIKRRSE